MSECDAMRERIPELLIESLPGPDRELVHRHIEECPTCEQEWRTMKETWQILGELPEVPVPPGLRQHFLAGVEQMSPRSARVIPFQPRRWLPARRLAQAAAVVLMVGGSYYAGGVRKQSLSSPAPMAIESPARIDRVVPASYSISESRVVPTSELSPDIQGQPHIQNVQFVRSATNQDDVAVSFDVTSHVTITGKPNDKSLVKLLSYVLQSQGHPNFSRSTTLDWVKDTYSDASAADPELVKAVADVLKNDQHEGARIKAVETLRSIPAALAPEARAALIDALQNDPNPAVRIKAIEVLAKLARTGGTLDPAAVEMLRKKASQRDENAYVRVKAAEALGQINL
jgi:hypothetical protein